MKKKLLLMMICVPVLLFAEGNGVKVSNLSVSAGTPSTVTFDVQWTNNHAPEFVWSDTVWVWVDYNNAGKMERLPVTGATASAGTVTKTPNNDKGVWLVGNARDAGAFSATVQLLTAIADFSGACAYASNYPPMGEYISSTEISFTGTPPYNIVLKDAGSGTETYTADSPYAVLPGYTVQSFIDKTGAPGTFTCIPSTVYTLVASASAFCEGGTGVTFALLGTDKGASYELYRNGTMIGTTLVGTSSPATFSGSFGAGTYTARTIPGGAFCPAEMTGVHDVSETPVPAPPIAVNGSRICQGSVTISASAPGAVIDWYEGATGGNPLLSGSNTYTTPSINASRNYYAQARAENCSYTSVSRTVVSISVTPSPTIQYDKAPSQYIVRGSALTTTVYKASNGTGLTLHSGAFPSGVSGRASSNSYTVSGTVPASATPGDYTYTLTTSNANGCTNASYTATIHVKYPITVTTISSPPSGSASTVYVCASTTWSSPIKVKPSACPVVTASTTTASTRINDNGDYSYNVACTFAATASLCPSPWRLPTVAEFTALMGLGYWNNALANEWVNVKGYVMSGNQTGSTDLWTADTNSSSTRMSFEFMIFMGNSWLFYWSNSNGNSSHAYWNIRCVR
jgi:hypothetical protein